MEQLLALEMVRVTEAAAIASARFMGRGEKDEADHAATEAMRRTMDEIDMAGTIVIGEGERDQAPMLYIGEQVGRPEDGEGRTAPEIDIAVDPLEGTNLVAHGQAGAITVLAASERGGLFHAPDTYLEKLCVGPVAAGQVDITTSPTENVHRIAEALRRRVNDITVVILERPRHDDLIAEVRAAGARIKLISDGDLSAAISCAVSGTGVHAVMGIGGAPEGVITAAALRCLGGEIQARFRFRNDEERERIRAMGNDDDESRVYRTEDLASGENLVFAATGVTHGDLLQGVRFFGGGARTHSLVMAYQSEAGPFRGHRPDVRPLEAAGGPPLGEAPPSAGRSIPAGDRAGGVRPLGELPAGSWRSPRSRPSRAAPGRARGRPAERARRGDRGPRDGAPPGAGPPSPGRPIRVDAIGRPAADRRPAGPGRRRAGPGRARVDPSARPSAGRTPARAPSGPPGAPIAPVAGSGPEGTSRATTALRNSGWSITPTGRVAYSRETPRSRTPGSARRAATAAVRVPVGSPRFAPRPMYARVRRPVIGSPIRAVRRCSRSAARRGAPGSHHDRSGHGRVAVTLAHPGGSGSSIGGTLGSPVMSRVARPRVRNDQPQRTMTTTRLANPMR